MERMDALSLRSGAVTSLLWLRTRIADVTTAVVGASDAEELGSVVFWKNLTGGGFGVGLH